MERNCMVHISQTFRENSKMPSWVLTFLGNLDFIVSSKGDDGKSVSGSLVSMLL